MNISNWINKNITKVIGLLTSLAIFFLFVGSKSDSLILGKSVLLLSALFVFIYDKIYGVFYFTMLIVFYWLFSFAIKENFALSDQSIQNFILLQHNINPNAIFDTNMLEGQVNQQELDYYNQHGIWPWSPDVIELYKNSVEKNPYVRTYSEDAVLNTRKIYNQSSILKILSYQTKEGKMLLTGVQVPNPYGNPYEDLPSGFGEFGYNSGLTTNLSKDVIKCNSSSNSSELVRIQYTGNEGIFGEQNKKTTKVDYNKLENIIPGFAFVNGACNPCSPLNEISDYSCPFELRVKGDEQISTVWKKLWNI
jgi:hypothetical protein